MSFWERLAGAALEGIAEEGKKIAKEMKGKEEQLPLNFTEIDAKQVIPCKGNYCKGLMHVETHITSKERYWFCDHCKLSIDYP